VKTPERAPEKKSPAPAKKILRASAKKIPWAPATGEKRDTRLSKPTSGEEEWMKMERNGA